MARACRLTQAKHSALCPAQSKRSGGSRCTRQARTEDRAALRPVAENGSSLPSMDSAATRLHGSPGSGPGLATHELGTLAGSRPSSNAPVPSTEKWDQSRVICTPALPVCCVCSRGLCEPQSAKPTSATACRGARLRPGRKSYRPAWLGGWGLAAVQGPWALQTKPCSYQGLVTRGSPLRLYVEAVCGQSHGKPKSERKMTKGEREKSTEDRVGQSVPGK